LPSIKRLLLATLFAGAVINCGFARDLDPDLRQYVIASCSVDAYRLCPQSLGNEHDAVSCMKSKRDQLAQTCRVAYDKVARVLRQ
jgi:hypothetical protein